jgi:hypothetical protein
VGAVYTLSFPSSRKPLAEKETRRINAGTGRPAAGDEGLERACQAAAAELLADLPASSHVLVRAPFVLAGDFSESELDRLYVDTVRPVTLALWRAFFDKHPDRPVTIVALGSEASYQAAAARLDGYEPRAYAGYTQRGQRRIVLNLATGRGTVAHELAHILAAFDFPEMPEWFDEGLASLHEDAHFSADGLTMIGAANWRSRLLGDALRNAELPPLAAVIASREFRGEGEGLNYAAVRCFCLYLQERSLLSHFYRKFRSAVHDDPDGVATLCALLGVATIDDVDRDFRAWLRRDDAPKNRSH